ncbi:MAG TPA: hypothetical protein VNE39_28065 [Planctomycetota bacterium]|nr:hypothetical protein [Planctomycetota bacterium]
MAQVRVVLALTACALAGPAAAAAQEQSAFQEAPTLRETARGREIAFALSRPADVTIRALDAADRVVRHLACGMVGLERAATPFAPHSLAQKIAWDGLDDGGKPVPAGTCRIVVGVGTRAKFDKFILWNPDGFGVLGSPNWAFPGAIAVGPRGELHVVEQYGVHYSTLRVFDREGRFVRCLWPLSLDKPKETLEPFFASTMTIWPADVAAWGATDWAGRTVPRSVSHSAFYWYGVRTNAMAVAPDGRVVLTDAHVTSKTCLLAIAPNGLPESVQGTFPWLDKGSYAKLWDLALGPDGSLYLSDKGYGIVAHLDSTTLQPVHSFAYRGTQKLDAPTYLLGEPKLGKVGVWDPLWALAVDKEGRIWLAKPRESCIQVCRKDGLLLASFDRIALAGGEQKINAGEIAMAANLKSGAVYLNLPVEKERRLVKLAFAETPKAVAEIALPRNAKRIAADGEGGLVWTIVGYDTLVRVQDLGDRLEAKTIEGLAGKTLAFPRLMSVGGDGRLLLADAASNYVASDIEGRAFQRLAWYNTGGHGYSAPDAEGNWLVAVTLGHKKHEIWKLSPEGKRLKFGDRDAIELEGVKEPKGLCLAPNGDLYVAVTATIPPERAKTLGSVFGSVDVKGDEHNYSRVDVYGPDGTLKKSGLVRLQGVNDVKLARDGSLYVVESGLCHGAHKRRAAKLDNQRFTLYNRLLKFAPEGGVRDGQGQLWAYQGLSGVSSYTCAGECPAAQLCVDADDRVWIPDPALYNVAAVDAAGNLMFRIGAYGNADCRGGGGDEMVPGTRVVRSPEIPLARPFGIAVWKDWLLIADMYSHRVLRCTLEHAERREIALQP